jgi:UDP-N-acetylmuramate dehydrogenase
MMAASSLQTLRGSMLLNEPMSKHTSWKIGGVAEQMYTPADIDDLALFLSGLPESEPVMFIGLGSNLLVRDGGIEGTVISFKGSMANIELHADNRVSAGAGISCAKLSRFCHRNNLLGGEFFAGIPGLLGGALAMNAGAFGGETWSVVDTVITIDRAGNIYTRTKKDYQIGYRSVKGHENEWFVSATLHLHAGNGEQAAQRVKQLLKQRSETQPTGLPSCGSVFKNPPGDYAARLIEASGLKGFRIGDAVVSEKHANFIINVGQAKAADVEALMKYIQQTVNEKFNVQLQSEVKIVGRYSND